MDVITRTATENGNTAQIEIQTRYNMTFYKVTLYSRSGREYNSNVYSLDNKKAANACFNRYRRKAKEI